MPKIRGVKPDYWTDEDIVDLSIPARLLFIGLWNHACDNGHLQDKPKQIKMRVLPGDDVNVSELLRELAERGRIERKGGVITVPNFAKHQRPDKRFWQTCDTPGCVKPEADSQRESRSAHHEPTTSARRGHASTPGDGDGDGELMVKGSDGESPRKRATQLPADWKPNDKHAEMVAERGLDGPTELAKFRDHAIANGRTLKDWDAGFRNWLRQAKSYQRPGRPARTSGVDLEAAMRRAEARDAQRGAS